MDTLRMPRSQHRALSDPIKAGVNFCIASYSQEQAANTLPGSVLSTEDCHHCPKPALPPPLDPYAYAGGQFEDFHRWANSLMPAIDHSAVL